MVHCPAEKSKSLLKFHTQWEAPPILVTRPGNKHHYPNVYRSTNRLSPQVSQQTHQRTCELVSLLGQDVLALNASNLCTL